MTEVQEAIKFERLSKFEHRYDDYDVVVEINGEEHNLDFLIDPLKNKIIFFYNYGDGDDLDDCKKEIKKLKEELRRCRNWINSDKNDYELTLAFIKNKGYSLKDVLEYEKELKSE